MEEETTSLSLTQKWQHEKKMGASVRTIKANVPTFIPTKASLPTFVFEDSNVNSDNKTINKENGEGNNNTDDSSNNVTDKDVFYGIAI